MADAFKQGELVEYREADDPFGPWRRGEYRGVMPWFEPGRPGFLKRVIGPLHVKRLDGTTALVAALRKGGSGG